MMFNVQLPEDSLTDALVEKSMRAEKSVRQVVVSLLEENEIPGSQYNEGLGAFVCWSMTHGVTTLAAKHVNDAACLGGHWPPEFMLNDTESIKKSFDAIADVLAAGILHAAKKDNS
mgnify:CR=1 FL=1